MDEKAKAQESELTAHVTHNLAEDSELDLDCLRPGLFTWSH